MTNGISLAMGSGAFHFIPMIRVITAIFTGAIISFTWGFISWKVIGWHPSDSSAVTGAITENAPSSSAYVIISFFNNLLCSLIITVCVLRIRATRFISRASIGAILGVFAAISMALPRWNWFETPDNHLIANIVDPIVAYTLAGIVIASIIKAPKARRIFS